MREEDPRPGIRTIPSSDSAFAALVHRIVAEGSFETPSELGQRLGRLFPRVLVRDRALAGEPPVWYVYRDGAWRPNEAGPWWTRAGLPRFVVSTDGYIVESNSLARSMLGMPSPRSGGKAIHFSDYVAPGTLSDATALFEIVKSVGELDGTVLTRQVDGNVVACDVHAVRQGRRLVAVLRLAGGIEAATGLGATAATAGTEGRPATATRPAALVTEPPSDTVFRQFAEDVLSNLPDTSAEAFELAVRPLYPHAHLERRTDDAWHLFRDGHREAGPAEGGWWTDPTLPRLRYDSEGLILEANEAAGTYLGRQLVGHYWYEFVTPTATDVVSPVIEMIRKAGVAISRFRMPTGDGSLVEFDSYTTADGETLTTIMRPT